MLGLVCGRVLSSAHDPLQTLHHKEQHHPMAPSIISFGDTVRIVSAPETQQLGIAGVEGSVYGETTPTVSGVDVVGTLSRDFALNVFVDKLQQSFWLAEQLVEFVDHGGGTTISIAGVSKRWVRTTGGAWVEEEA